MEEILKCRLEEVSTKDLVNELSTREGVEETVVDPYEDFNVNVNGPAIVLVVYD